MVSVFRPLVGATGCLIIAACASGSSHPHGVPVSISPRATASHAEATAKPTATAATPSPVAGPLAPASGPTPGTAFSLDNVALATGEGISFVMHPTEAAITLRANASMPLEVCPDLDPSSGGSGLSWPSHILSRCWLLSSGRWVQLPSTRTSAWHIAFRVTAIHPGTISSLDVSYQRVDTALSIISSASTFKALTLSFTPAGRSAAATLYGSPDFGPLGNGKVLATQNGSEPVQTGACNPPTEAAACLNGLTPGRPVTLKVLHASDPVAVSLDLVIP
jgi:hypothetical protein